jgi:hypothetical protein
MLRYCKTTGLEVADTKVDVVHLEMLKIRVIQFVKHGIRAVTWYCKVSGLQPPRPVEAPSAGPQASERTSRATPLGTAHRSPSK